MKLTKLALLLVVILTSQTASAPSGKTQPDSQLGSGLQHFTEKIDFGNGPAEVNVLRVDLQIRKVRPSLAGQGIVGLDTVPRLAASARAMAAVNGDFWRGGQPPNQGDPASLYISDRNVVSRPITQSSRGIMTGRGSAVSLLPGINEFRIDLTLGSHKVSVDTGSQEINSVDITNPSGKSNRLAIFTSGYGGTVPIAENAYLLLIEDIFPDNRLRANQVYKGKVARELPRGQSFTVPPRAVVVAFYSSVEAQVPAAMRKVGAAVALTVRLPREANGWDWACGGFPTLVRNGQANTFQGWHDSGVINAHPRTAVALDPKGRYMYLVTVDGRYPEGKPGGATMAALAQYLTTRWHVQAALNLDGGGSTTMVVATNAHYEIVNRPSDGSPRRVAQIILVY